MFRYCYSMIGTRLKSKWAYNKRLINVLKLVEYDMKMYLVPYQLTFSFKIIRIYLTRFNCSYFVISSKHLINLIIKCFSIEFL